MRQWRAALKINLTKVSPKQSIANVWAYVQNYASLVKGLFVHHLYSMRRGFHLGADGAYTEHACVCVYIYIHMYSVYIYLYICA